VGCRSCGSETQQELVGELTASLPNIKGLTFRPLYASQHVWVCLDCGFAELVIPPAELQRLKKAVAPSSSPDSR
jgi:hypothetical protein